MTDAIDNAIDDMLLARIAGADPDPDVDYSYTYPPHKWGAQPGHMPTVADIVAERDALRAEAERQRQESIAWAIACQEARGANAALRAERDMLVELVKAFCADYPLTSGIAAGVTWCRHCNVDMTSAKRVVTDHAEDCSWRMAKEWMARQEAGK
jgi:hypothetical protein